MIKKGLNGRDDKKAQMHIPFQLIFSVILIAVFLIVAFFVIRHFLELQRCTQVGLFVQDLQAKVDEVWRAQEASTSTELSLPSSLKYICFANLTSGMNLVGVKSDEREELREIYDELRVYFKYRDANLFLYPSRSACNMPTHTVEHVNLEGMSNPYCLPNIKGKVKIRLSKGFDDALVRVRR